MAICSGDCPDVSGTYSATIDEVPKERSSCGEFGVKGDTGSVTVTQKDSAVAFAELTLWQLPKSLPGSVHRFKYRLAYVVRGISVLRYDNEAGKGDHRHYGGKESAYAFTNPDNLIAAFQADIARWNRENSDS